MDGKRDKPYGCDKCVELNLLDCTHCFYCGENGHRAVGGLKNQKTPGKLSVVSSRGQAVTESRQSQPDISHNGESDKMSVAAWRCKDKDNVADGPRQTNLTSSTSSHALTNSKGKCLAKLIGRKALSECNRNGLAVTALLDSGAQVSMIDRYWKNKYLNDANVKIVDDEEGLKVHAVNGDIIPFDGWIAVTGNLK